MTEDDEHSQARHTLTFGFAPELTPLLTEHPALKAALAHSLPEHVQSTCHDTPDGQLARNGLTLIVCRSDGHPYQILTWDEKDAGPFPGSRTGRRVREGEYPTPALFTGTVAEHPDIAGRLQPLWTAHIQRNRGLLATPAHVITLALDVDMLCAGRAKEAIHELTLELQEGSPAALYRLGLELQTLPLWLTNETLSLRGAMLRTGRAPASVKARSPKLRRHTKEENAFRDIVRAGLGALRANQPAAAHGNAEGVHQMRIAIRRLRTVLKLFEPDLEPLGMAQWNVPLQNLGRVLGEARDWDVFCSETLAAQDAVLKDTAWGQAFRQQAEEKRALAHEALRHVFHSSSFTTLLLGMTLWVEEEGSLLEGGRSTDSLSARAPHLLDRMARKTHRRGRHIKRLSDEELHALRKSLKKLRYSAENFGALFPSRAVKLYLKQCKRIQDLFGAYNDAVVMAALTERLCRDDPQLEAARGLFGSDSETRRHNILRHLPAAWRTFSDAPLFWRC